MGVVWVGGQHHAPAALPPGKTRYPLYRRLGGPQGRSGRVRKISPTTGIRSPDSPACSESLYRLSYPGPCLKSNSKLKLRYPYYFLDALAELRKLTISFVMSVRPHGTTRLLLDRFSRNLVWEYFSKICQVIQVSLN